MDTIFVVLGCVVGLITLSFLYLRRKRIQKLQSIQAGQIIEKVKDDSAEWFNSASLAGRGTFSTIGLLVVAIVVAILAYSFWPTEWYLPSSDLTLGVVTVSRGWILFFLAAVT